MTVERAGPAPAARSGPTDQRAAPSASKEERVMGATAGTAVAGGVALLAIAFGGPSGLGSALLFTAVAIVALDAAAGIQITRRAVLTATVHPTDVVAGDRFAIQVAVRGWRMPLVLVNRPGIDAGELLVEPPCSGTMEGRAATRGVIQTLKLAVQSKGLCGLLTCTRAHYARLTRVLEVGPRPVVPGQPFPELGGGWGDGSAAPAPDGELVRGLRDYLPGDRLRQVHWRATAHTGELVVKETEEPQAPVLHLVLDMGPGGEAGEAAAGRCSWYAGEALRRGYQVTLTTVEDGHPLTDATPSMLLVNRRLARAGLGAPARPKGVARGVRVLLVGAEGDSWP